MRYRRLTPTFSDSGKILQVLEETFILINRENDCGPSTCLVDDILHGHGWKSAQSQ